MFPAMFGTYGSWAMPFSAVWESEAALVLNHVVVFTRLDIAGGAAGFDRGRSGEYVKSR